MAVIPLFGFQMQGHPAGAVSVQAQGECWIIVLCSCSARKMQALCLRKLMLISFNIIPRHSRILLLAVCTVQDAIDHGMLRRMLSDALVWMCTVQQPVCHARMPLTHENALWLKLWPGLIGVQRHRWIAEGTDQRRPTPSSDDCSEYGAVCVHVSKCESAL